MTKDMQNRINYIKQNIINISNIEICLMLAQYHAETGGFKYYLEDITEEEANREYGGRYGNNNEGDGFYFRGRGWCQLTFRNNYREYFMFCNKAINDDNLAYLTTEQGASEVGVWFWVHMARRPQNIDDATRAINGREATDATLTERRNLYQFYLKQLGV